MELVSKRNSLSLGGDPAGGAAGVAESVFRSVLRRWAECVDGNLLEREGRFFGGNGQWEQGKMPWGDRTPSEVSWSVALRSCTGADFNHVLVESDCRAEPNTPTKDPCKTGLSDIPRT
jgi:hypothetical protein